MHHETFAHISGVNLLVMHDGRDRDRGDRRPAHGTRPALRSGSGGRPAGYAVALDAEPDQSLPMLLLFVEQTGVGGRGRCASVARLPGPPLLLSLSLVTVRTHGQVASTSRGSNSVLNEASQQGRTENAFFRHLRRTNPRAGVAADSSDNVYVADYGVPIGQCTGVSPLGEGEGRETQAGPARTCDTWLRHARERIPSGIRGSGEC
jgi:hypothetical protein